MQLSLMADVQLRAMRFEEVDTVESKLSWK